jgi:hypoxanthine phosphoribosyltransferase
MGMYKKDDLIQISYREFGETMDAVTQDIANYQKANDINFNLVVPLLRSGAFPAYHIAARLEIKETLPVYYMYEHGKLVKRLEVPKTSRALPNELHVLICDSCLTSGTTLKSAVEDLKLVLPGAKFYAAIVWLEEGADSFACIEHIFYGRRTCEKKTSQNPNTINGILVAPWEDLEVDWNEIKGY